MAEMLFHHAKKHTERFNNHVTLNTALGEDTHMESLIIVSETVRFSQVYLPSLAIPIEIIES